MKLQNRLSRESNKKDVGKTFKVLIEGDSKRSDDDWRGRNTQNKVVVFPKRGFDFKKGDYVLVKVNDCTGATLIGEALSATDTCSGNGNFRYLMNYETFY